MTYIECITVNIGTLEQLIRLNPRIGLLALDSEIEIMFKEVLPKVLWPRMQGGQSVNDGDCNERWLDEQFDEEQRRAQLSFRAHRIRGLPRHQREVLRELSLAGNACRHTRHSIQRDVALRLTARIVGILQELPSVVLKDAFVCKDRRWGTPVHTWPYRFADVLQREPYDLVDFTCDTCGEDFGQVHLPSVEQLQEWVDQSTDNG